MGGKRGSDPSPPPYQFNRNVGARGLTPQGNQQGPPIVPYMVAVGSTLQMMASAPLIFLFLLAVRNLFRLK